MFILIISYLLIFVNGKKHFIKIKKLRKGIIFMSNTTFNYFYEDENEQYLFLQMPIMLIKDEKFKDLSDGAKILYSLLLNRTALSRKNNWKDEQNRIYIIYPIAEIMTDLNCCDKSATKKMNELKKCGLIQIVRRGLNKPNIIYVMNFATELKYKEKERKTPIYPRNSKIYESGTEQNTNQEENIIRSINIYQSKNDLELDLSIYQPGKNNAETLINKPTSAESFDNDLIDIPQENIYEIIADNISLTELRQENSNQTQEIEQLYKIVCDILKMPNNTDTKIRIAKQYIPLLAVKQAFFALNKNHFTYILSCLEKNDNGNKIKSNARGYYLASLYNSLRTIDFYSKPQNKLVKSDIDMFFEKSVKRTMKF